MTDMSISDFDLFADEALLDPYPIYETLRARGGAVWMEKYKVFAYSRYDDVKHALATPKVYSSAYGVTYNDKMNHVLRNGLLCSDAPHHDTLRRVIERPLTPKALSALRDRVRTAAEALVDRLVAQKTFDAATELAQYLPVTIVSELVGLPEEGREKMLEWAAANFNCIGPINQRTEAAFPIVEEMVHYALTQCVPGKLAPDSWAERIWTAADNGEIDRDLCPFLMNDYMGPSLDTTIFATANAIWLFARHPEQWDVIRRNPALIPQAVNEVIRLESPIQGFTRYVTRDVEVDGTPVPTGSRVAVLYASANRDERKWRDPDTFDVLRDDLGDHLGFGFGEHQCVGNNLARMEIRLLLTALASRVERFELGETRRVMNNVLRGFSQCIVTVS